MADYTYKPQNYSLFKGMVTLDEADTLKDEECVYAQNVDVGSGGSILPRKGKTLFGNDTAGLGSCASCHVTKRRDGTQQPIRQRGTSVEYYDSTNNTWNTLVTGLTSTAEPLGWADYVTSTYDAVYFGNGTDTTIKWNTGVTHLTAAIAIGDVTITVSDTTAFTSSGSVVIEGETITYASKTATTLAGCTGTLTVHASGSGVAQTTSTISAIEKGNILMVKDWRLSIAGTPTKGPTMTLSQINTPETFTEHAPREVGDADIEDFPEGGGSITSLAESDKWWIIFKEDTIREFTLDITQGAGDTNMDAEVPATKVVVTAPGIGAINHKGTTGAENDIFYVSRTGGVRSLNSVLQSNGTPSLNVVDWTDVIRPTIQDYSFDDAASVFFDKKVLVACKSSSGVTYNDTVIVIDLRTKGLSLYKGWNVADWFIYNSDLYFGASNEGNTYKCFDGNTDVSHTASIGIDTIWRTKRFNFGQPSLQKETDLIYIEGLISDITSIDVTIRYDEEGARSEITKTIEGDGSYVVQTPVSLLGTDELGIEPLAGSTADISDLNKFRVYLTLPQDVSCFNLDLIIRSNTVGGRWKITNYSINPITQEEVPAQLKL